MACSNQLKTRYIVLDSSNQIAIVNLAKVLLESRPIFYIEYYWKKIYKNTMISEFS
jgi:hypothetical protein